MQFFYSATNGSDTGSVVAAVVGNEATANLSDLLPATTYTVYGVVTATNGSTPQSSSTTFTTEGARTDHAAWYELPARTTADATITQTVYPASGSQRNYTMYYDKSTYTAYWVAYPLAKGHMGNGRSDKWQRNPGLAESEQINVWSSSYGVNLGATTSDGYDNSKEFYARGHQIPNADRNGSDELVVQTYYATNSTPQIQNKFNGGIWQQLESGVRNITATTDTVYVVTGAILQTAGNHEAITWITPKSDSKRCPVPNYYYKALLKVRRDASNKVTSAMTIGFWMEHREYSNDSYTNYATSVAETFRLFGPCRTEVVSLHDECKEVVVYTDGTGPLLTAVALELGEFSCTPAEARATPCDKPFDPAAYRWLLIPDVALQKARLTPTYLQGHADIWSPNGYGFAAEKSEDTLGRWLEIERIEPYNPKQLKRELSGSRLTILKQDFPLTAAEIAARLGIREGGERRIAFTKLGQDYWTIRLK